MRPIPLAPTIAAVLFLGSCSQQQGPIDRLPELPDELRSTLARSGLAPILATKAPVVPASSPTPAPQPPPPQTAKVCVTHYLGYVVYPYTVCYPPSILAGSLDWNRIQTPSAASAAQPSRFFKLSAFEGLAIAQPFFCTSKGGPWYAELDSRPRCENINISDFLLIINGPQPVEVKWSGTRQNGPPSINLNNLTAAGEDQCVCCNGTTLCPNGQCVPPGVSCSTQTNPK